MGPIEKLSFHTKLIRMGTILDIFFLSITNSQSSPAEVHSPGITMQCSAMEKDGLVGFQLRKLEQKMENAEERKMRLTFSSTCNLNRWWIKWKSKSKGWKKETDISLFIKKHLRSGSSRGYGDQRLRHLPLIT